MAKQDVEVVPVPAYQSIRDGLEETRRRMQRLSVGCSWFPAVDSIASLSYHQVTELLDLLDRHPEIQTR